MIESSYYCAFCNAVNEITIDPTEGYVQRTEEECEKCDHLNFLQININPDSMEAEVESREEE